jgi:hypothetical protein
MFGYRNNHPKVQAEPCPVCQGLMELVRVIPPAPTKPPLFSFKCTVCTCPKTLEVDLPRVESPTLAA